MPWYNQWSDSLKKRACRYLLQRYLGQFLEEKLTLDQLTVDLYNGTGSVSGVVLDVQALNELGEQENLPIEFVDGYISEMSVSIPLSQLFTESSYIEVTGLLLTVQPKKRTCDGGSMFESMWNSMSNSMQLAAECLQQTADDKESESANLMEGLELFANAIESVLTRVKIKFVNTVLRLEHLPRKGKNGIAVEIRINNIDYCDEACSDPVYSDINQMTTYQSTFSVKKFHCESIHFFTDEFPVACRTFSRSIISKQDVDKTFFQTKSQNEPILFGKLSGRQEIRLKLKQDDSVRGPKVDIELNFGSLTLFISPRQMHLIIELIHSLGSPHTQDTSNVEPKSMPQKPMNLCDYEKVEQDLQENISCPPVENKLKEKSQINTGWSSASIDEIEEEFLPMKANIGVSDSIISDVTMDSSINSTYTSATLNSKCSSSSFENASWTNKKRNSKKGVSSISDSDFSGEMTGFNIRLASLSAVILHEDLLMFDADSSSLTSMSASVMKDISNSFFQSLGLYEIQSYGNKDFNKIKDLLSSSCPHCHIRLIATAIIIEGHENGTPYSRSVNMSLTSASFQATECIYSEKTKDNICTPQYVELLNFMRSGDNSVKPHFPITGMPDIRLDFKQLKKFRNVNQTSYIKMDISVTLQQCWTEVDLSIIDRVNAILHSEILCQTSCASKESMNEVSSFSKAVENSSVADVKFDFKLSTPFLVIKFRFPIPDLRPVHDMEHNPWWKRNVRKDILYFNLIEPTVLTESDNRTYLQSYKVYCSEIITLFQEGNTNMPIPFARATKDKHGNKPSKIGQCIGLPCISFRVCPKEIIDELEEPITEDVPILSHSCFMDTPSKQPSPFSFKHVVHGNTQSVGGLDNMPSSEVYGEELIVPADKQEMSEFTNYATRTARIQVDVSLPFVAVHFPSKHFYEVIYNRLNSDLSLWQSSAQKLHSTGMGSNMHVEDYLRHPLFPAFSMCKSGLLYDSDPESEDSNPGAFTSNNTKYKQKNSVSLSGQSKYALNIAVNHGLLNINTNLKDISSNNPTSQRGELQINVDEASLFMVNYYKGMPQQNYVCLLVNEVTLYHKDVHVDDPYTSSPLFTPNENPSHLNATIYYQHTAITSKCLSDSSKDMLRAAIHTEVKENRVKNIRVSCGLQNATLRHKVCLPQHAWLTQLMDFFDVIDYPVRGYDSPQVITELHQHLWDCAVDYRPLHLPLKTVLTVGNLSLSSNIAARTKSSTFRFIAEDANLFLSDKVNNQFTAINLKSDYISVIELGLFELFLRLSDNVRCPKVDLKALINIVNIRTCSDSARALAQLIKYFASDGDLNVLESSNQNTSQPLTLSNINHETKNSLSESTVERVNNMMEDAMLDERNESCKAEKLSNVPDEAKDVEEFLFPDEGAQNDDSLPVDWGGSDLESDHDFCLLEHEAGSGMMPKSGMPEVRILSSSPINVIDNYFNLAIGKVDLLLPPKHYPTPVFRYTLQDMTLIWHMYGGSDFSSKKNSEKHVRISSIKESSSEAKKSYIDTNIDETVSDKSSNFNYPFEKKVIYNNGKSYIKESSKVSPNKYASWHIQGGKERNNNILMQLQLNKVKFQHEIYPEKSVQASRQVLLVHELEVRDRLSTSNINKFLYQYTSEASPRQSHANMVVIKAVHIRPDPRRNVQETCLKLSLLPLRLNIDQDSLIFLIDFFSQLSGVQKEGCDETSQAAGTMHHIPVMSVDNESSQDSYQPSEIVCVLDDEANNVEKPCTVYINETSASNPLYIRSFVFTPEVPIRIDYEGKRVDMTHGSLAGLLMGLGQLSCLQLKLKKLSYRHGILGFDKLASFVVSEWVQDIKKNQLPNLIGGVGPMHSLVQLFQGIRDLFWMPIEQYQKDGRIVRGLQKGANSFTTSTAIAALEITARIVQAIQSVAETAFDMLSPGPSARRLHGKRGKRQHRYTRPADIREGIANAYTLVKEGLGETAETLVRVASVEAEQKGAVGAVGGVLRQIPPTVVAPIILASAATSNLLGGVRSQLAPDARREETNKWRTEDTC